MRFCVCGWPLDLAIEHDHGGRMERGYEALQQSVLELAHEARMAELIDGLGADGTMEP